MDDNLVHTTPNHHTPNMDVFPKTFLQIIIAAKWLVRYLSTYPKQQRRPLFSLLTVSSYSLPEHTTGWPVSYWVDRLLAALVLRPQLQGLPRLSGNTAQSTTRPECSRTRPDKADYLSITEHFCAIFKEQSVVDPIQTPGPIRRILPDLDPQKIMDNFWITQFDIIKRYEKQSR